jgi:hypothetical protein
VLHVEIFLPDLTVSVVAFVELSDGQALGEMASVRGMTLRIILEWKALDPAGQLLWGETLMEAIVRHRRMRYSGRGSR